MTDPLPPIPQSWHEENRTRFDAESSSFDLKNLSHCDHFVERVSFSEVRCKKCPAGWTDNNHFIIENGKITGVKDK